MKVWAPVGAEGSVSRTEKTPLFQNGHNFTVNLGHGETITADPIFDEDLRAKKGCGMPWTKTTPSNFKDLIQKLNYLDWLKVIVYVFIAKSM